MALQQLVLLYIMQLGAGSHAHFCVCIASKMHNTQLKQIAKVLFTLSDNAVRYSVVSNIW